MFVLFHSDEIIQVECLLMSGKYMQIVGLVKRLSRRWRNAHFIFKFTYFVIKPSFIQTQIYST